MMIAPETRYVSSGGYELAYQVVGEGEIDVVWVGGFATNVDAMWDVPIVAEFMERISSWSRLILFDKRGTGVSDRVRPGEMPTLADRLSDLTAVLDAADSEKAALVGDCDGGALSAVFAATYPQRVSALVLGGAIVAPLERSVADDIVSGWGTGASGEYWSPSIIDLPGARERFAKWERSAVSRSAVAMLFDMAANTDVRATLPAVSVPTLVLHRTGDRAAPVEHAREAAKLIGCQLGELPGEDHTWWSGDSEPYLTALQSFLFGEHTPPALGRALTTVLFTDIIGSTDLAGRLGDTAWRHRLDLHDRTIAQTVHRYQGRVVKQTGDGALACFDRPSDAVRAGMSIIQELSSSGLHVRSGVHTGECELRDGDLSGITVHIAARVMGLAAADEVLVTQTVRDLLAGSGIALESRGSHTLRGLNGQWDLLAASTEGASAEDDQQPGRILNPRSS